MIGAGAAKKAVSCGGSLPSQARAQPWASPPPSMATQHSDRPVPQAPCLGPGLKPRCRAVPRQLGLGALRGLPEEGTES